jgi:hypothetical protein
MFLPESNNYYPHSTIYCLKLVVDENVLLLILNLSDKYENE